MLRMIKSTPLLTKLCIDFVCYLDYNFYRNTLRQNLYDVRAIMVSFTTYKEFTMTENEVKLIEMIHNHTNPDKAFVTALEVILVFLKHHESSVSERSVGFRESV